MADLTDSTGRFFAYQHPQAAVTAVGTLSDGAKVAVLDPAAGIDVLLELPPAEFTVLVLLMRRAIAAGELDENAAGGHFQTVDLFAKLKRLWGISDPQTVARSIYRLRQRLNHAAQKVLDEDQAHDWSLSLIEHSRFGYRLSVPPRQLHLDVLDAQQLSPLD